LVIFPKLQGAGVIAPTPPGALDQSRDLTIIVAVFLATTALRIVVWVVGEIKERCKGRKKGERT
jgi:hypothetical protein